MGHLLPFLVMKISPSVTDLDVGLQWSPDGSVLVALAWLGKFNPASYVLRALASLTSVSFFYNLRCFDGTRSEHLRT